MGQNAWGGWMPDNVPLHVIMKEESGGRVEENTDGFLNPTTGKVLPANIESLIEQSAKNKQDKGKGKGSKKAKEDIIDSGSGIEGTSEEDE